MKTKNKVMTASLLMALICAAAATISSAKPNKVEGQLAVRDVLTADISKDITGRYVKRQADVEAMNVVSDVKAQISEAVEGKRHIRFVAAIDSYKYADAKFDIVVKNGDEVVKTFADKAVTTAYTHIEADGKVLSAAEAFGDEKYNYLIAFTVNNVPESAWGYTFEASASIRTEMAEEFTTTNVAKKVMNEMVFVDALGGADIFANITNKANSGNKIYEWQTSVVDGAVNMTSTNKGVHSSKSVISFELAKDSVVSFDYAISGEATYDDLFVYVYATAGTTKKTVKLEISGNSTENFITGSYIEKLVAGNVIEIIYNKDSSGNRGEDMVNISNLSFTNGVPAVNITKVYNDGLTENSVENGDLVAELGESVLAAPENVRGEEYKFGGWYYDAELTQPASSTDILKKVNVTLYANWLTKVTVNFVVPEGATAVDPVTVWSYTAMDIENPTMYRNIFRGWYLDENYETLVDIANNGVAQGCTLYAKFEELPEGAARDTATQIIFEEGTTIWQARSVATTEEFQNYYFEFTPTISTEYYVVFENYSHSGYTGSTYSSHARMWIEDSNGNVIYNDFPSSNTSEKYKLEANETYYLVFNGSKYTTSGTSWGTFDLNVMYFNHHTAENALPYAGIGETVNIEPGTFTHRNEEIVYSYTAEEASNYLLSLTSDGWAGIKVYEESIENENLVLNKSTYNKTSIFDIAFEADKTYYFVLSQNWNLSELSKKTMSFKVMEYGKGYIANNPNDYVIGEELVTDFSGGFSQYHHFATEAEATYKVTTTGGSTSYDKFIEIYAANDLTKALFTLSGTNELHDYVKLPAGDYIIKTYYSNTTNPVSFKVVVDVAQPGVSMLNPVDVNLPEDNNVIAEMTGSGYYSFSTGSQSVFHFFTADDTSAVITIMDINGTKVAESINGAVYVKLDTETDYVVKVTLDDEASSVNVTYHTADKVIDGKTPDSAYTLGTDSIVLANDFNGTSNNSKYSVWFKIEVTESGTYTFYTLNNGTIDTRGYLYSEDNTTKYLKENDDGGTEIMSPLGGYKYDFYLTCDLVAGETYYINVVYTIYNANNSPESGVSLTLNVVKE